MLASALACAACGATTPSLDGIEFYQTETDIRYGIWSKPAQRHAPLLFLIGGSIEDTLGAPGFRKSGQFLAPEGWLCVAIDLPCHGQEIRPNERLGLAGWRDRLDHQENVVTQAVDRLSQVLDQLVADGLGDPERVAAVGTSRGGFIALHFAARDSRVKCVAAFAPVTDLRVLTEFQGSEAGSLAQTLALENQTLALAGRPVWLVIGDRDVRVGTDQSIAFARRLTEMSLAKKLPAVVELHVVPEPRGHSVPDGWALKSATWIKKQFPPSTP